jgi:hypothetical protein
MQGGTAFKKVRKPVNLFYLGFLQVLLNNRLVDLPKENLQRDINEFHLVPQYSEDNALPDSMYYPDYVLGRFPGTMANATVTGQRVKMKITPGTPIRLDCVPRTLLWKKVTEIHPEYTKIERLLSELHVSAEIFTYLDLSEEQGDIRRTASTWTLQIRDPDAGTFHQVCQKLHQANFDFTFRRFSSTLAIPCTIHSMEATLKIRLSLHIKGEVGKMIFFEFLHHHLKSTPIVIDDLHSIFIQAKGLFLERTGYEVMSETSFSEVARYYWDVREFFHSYLFQYSGDFE